VSDIYLVFLISNFTFLLNLYLKYAIFSTVTAIFLILICMGNRIFQYYLVFVNMPIDTLAVIPAIVSQVTQDVVFMYLIYVLHSAQLFYFHNDLTIRTILALKNAQQQMQTIGQ